MPNKVEEVNAIRKVCQTGEMKKVKPIKVDIKLVSKDNDVFFIDVKTAKPNKSGFKEYKRNLLEWTACVLADNPWAKINTLVAIPYNPYEPKPYDRWTMRGMLDLDNEIKVAADFWDFLGGKGVMIICLIYSKKSVSSSGLKSTITSLNIRIETIQQFLLHPFQQHRTALSHTQRVAIP